MTRPFFTARGTRCLAAAALATALAPATSAAQQDAALRRDSSAVRDSMMVRDSVGRRRTVAPRDTAEQYDSTGNRAHRVRTGDTLWEIAGSYLGDPFLWPAVYRVNTSVVENPHWIYPGENIRIPGADAAPADSADADLLGEDAVDGDEDSEPTDAEPTDAEPADAEGSRATGTRTPVRAAVPRSGMLTRPASVRQGEFFAAPYVDRGERPAGAGTIVESADIPGATQLTTRPRFQLNDRIFITPPAGTRPAVGDQYLTVAPKARLDGLGRVMLPTGVLTVEEAQSGTAARVRLTQQFDVVKLTDLVIPVPTGYQSSSARPEPVERGATGRVVWLQSEPLLASLQQFVILEVARGGTMRPGDILTFVAERRSGRNGVALPEVRIGTAQVLRVTPGGVSAVVISQEQPAIRPGTIARVTATLR